MRRIERSDHARFLTFSCYGQRGLFAKDDLKDAFADQLRLARDRHDFKLYAWVLMPEHVHMVLRAHGESPIPTILRTLKVGIAKRAVSGWREQQDPILRSITDPRGATRFWARGGGYDRNLVLGDELFEKLQYVHKNPVRRGLVTRPEDWRWSSARWWSGRRDGQIPCDQIG